MYHELRTNIKEAASAIHFLTIRLQKIENVGLSLFHLTMNAWTAR